MASRRDFLQSAALSLAAVPALLASEEFPSPLQEFGYGEVRLLPGAAESQFQNTQSVLLSLDDDSLLKPWRLRAGLPAPGPEMGGWYDEVPLHKTDSGGHGFAPGHSFGQWLSALARGYAATGDQQTRAKLERLLALYEPAISGQFYANFRFPAYDYDKLVIGLVDAKRFANIVSAKRLLDKTTDAAEPHLPPTALDRDEPQRRWRASIGESTADDYTWDESYTLPENLFIAWEHGAGERYHKLASRFLLDRTYFDPLAAGVNVLPHHHAYSFCNALSSAMQAYLADGSLKHLHAAQNAFQMISEGQSFATGGWGPDESFGDPATSFLVKSLSNTHRGFETPCGSYAHCKLTRYLLRVTRDGRYGDSMERVLYNTVLGALPLQPDGRAFYYSDYHSPANKTYFPDKWPCCSGTLPQITADYRVMLYFRDRDGLFVNLYLPSDLHWTTPDGAAATIEQRGNYPFDETVALRIRLSRPSQFAIRLRVPAFTAGRAVIRVNGQASPIETSPGFATLRRRWADGDQIALAFPLTMRLEPLDKRYPDTVALMSGPLVLFPLGDEIPPASRAELLSAGQDGNPQQWLAETANGSIRFKPFTAITSNEGYGTYMTV